MIPALGGYGPFPVHPLNPTDLYKRVVLKPHSAIGGHKPLCSLCQNAGYADALIAQSSHQFRGLIGRNAPSDEEEEPRQPRNFAAKASSCSLLAYLIFSSPPLLRSITSTLNPMSRDNCSSNSRTSALFLSALFPNWRQRAFLWRGPRSGAR